MNGSIGFPHSADHSSLKNHYAQHCDKMTKWWNDKNDELVLCND